jgi:alkanesulfonate monooxygenase SsuD/methylene tetrahydromethanopterin reductase-like flavin-dependent oxidoreductase (luciferase family)
MLAYTAVGLPDQVASYLEGFAAGTGADELMTVHYSDSVPNRLRSVELLAGALDPAGAG